MNLITVSVIISIVIALFQCSCSSTLGSSFISEGRPSSNYSESELLPNYVNIWRQTKSVPVSRNQSVVLVASARKAWAENGNSDIEADELIDAIKELERDADADEANLGSTEDGQGLSLYSRKVPEEFRDNDDESLPEDLSQLPEDIADDIAAGVEESLLLTAGQFTTKNDSKVETRQFPIYMFQGSYMSEPRLNRFIDGALRNMGTELRISIMDPLFFRVLPKGRVESRPHPTKAIGKKREGKATGIFKLGRKVINKMNPFAGNKRRRIKNRRRKKGKPIRRRPGQVNGSTVIRRKVVKRKPLRRRPVVIRRRKPVRYNNNRNKNRKKPGKRKPGSNRNRDKKNKNRRQKRRLRRHVGGGRVEGLSCITRDGDAEMQVFGNYTLVRSHMKMGPVELAMQFRTRRGLRRTGATLPFLRVHTVTRVSQDGSEMVDFLLDRPHPESIKVRGRLFPLAERIARNIFSRLFVPTSFLTSQLRDKAGLALLSKPKK